MAGTAVAIAILSLLLLLALTGDVLLATAWRTAARDLHSLQRRTWSPYERDDYGHDEPLPPGVDGWPLGGSYGRTVHR